MRKQVLLVEDEPEIAAALSGYFERDGMDVVAKASVAEGLAALEASRPDVLILDVMLPDGSGFDVLRAAAANGRIPTLMLTARSDEIDRILGLELGADDYIAKPFSPREVVARVRAVLRRSEPSTNTAAARAEAANVIRIGELSIDPHAHEVRRAGTSVNVTPSEFKILHLLARNPGQVFTRAQLLDALGDEGTIYERTLDRHVNNLRRKVEPVPDTPEYVLTVFGVGYKMRKP